MKCESQVVAVINFPVWLLQLIDESAESTSLILVANIKYRIWLEDKLCRLNSNWNFEGQLGKELDVKAIIFPQKMTRTIAVGQILNYFPTDHFNILPFVAPPAGLCDEQDSQNHRRPNILTKHKGWTWAESHHIWIFTLFEVFQRIHLQRDFIVWIPPFMLNRHFIEPTTTTSEERTIENQIVKI